MKGKIMAKTKTKTTKKSAEITAVIRKISESELLGMFCKEKGVNFEGMDCKVKVKMNKRGNPYHDKVWKFYTVNSITGANYEKSVNRQREREGLETDFIAQEVITKKYCHILTIKFYRIDGIYWPIGRAGYST